jgi:hypothetical protein
MGFVRGEPIGLAPEKVLVPPNSAVCRWVPSVRFGPLARVDPRHRLAGHPSEGLNFSLQGARLGRIKPVLEGVPVALGSAPAGAVHSADARPLTAGAWHCSPLRFDLAWHRNAWRIGKLCMGLILRFSARPYPLGRGVDVADDRLTTISDIDVLDDHAPPPGAVSSVIMGIPAGATASAAPAPASNCRLTSFVSLEYQPEYTTVCGPE